MDTEVLILIHQIEKRNRRHKLIAAAAIMVLGLAMVITPYVQSMRGSIFWILAGVLFVIIAVLLALHTLSVHPFGRRNIAQWLQEAPEQVVWVYPHIVENMPFGIKLFNITMLYFNLMNGDNLQLNCTASQAYRLMDMLRQHLPQASFGYSQEKEFMFANDPKLLLRKKDG